MTEIKIYFKKRARRNNIAVRISIEGQGNFEVSTGLSTPKGSDLKIQKGRILIGNHPKVEDLNDALYDFKKNIKDFAKKLELVNGELTPQDLRQAIVTGNVRSHTFKEALQTYIDDLEAGKISNKKTSRPLAPDTLRSRLSSGKTLLSFAHRYENLDLGKYNMKTAALIGNSRVVSEFKKFYTSFIRVLHEEDYDGNTIYDYVQEIKRILRHVFGDTDIYIEPFLKHFVYQKNVYKRVLLSSDQYNFFIDNYQMIYDNAQVNQRPFVDYWYVALSTCARHKDMKDWRAENMSEKKGIFYLNYTTSKGFVDISIPLKKQVVEIFKKNIKEQGGRLMVMVNNISTTIKKVASEYPIYQIPVVTKRIRGGRKVTETVPYYELMSLHKMRGSGMTAMRRGSVPDHVIKQWSSHKENSVAFGRYFDTEQKELLDTAKAFYG